MSDADVDYGEPFTVQRLRGMVANLSPELQQHSTTLWAANEIDSLRAEVARLQAVLDGPVVDLREELGMANAYIADLRTELSLLQHDYDERRS